MNKITYKTLGKNTIIQDDELHQRTYAHDIFLGGCFFSPHYIGYWICQTESKTFKFIMKFIVENKNIYYPVDTGATTERSQWNYWFTIGWYTFVIILYFFIAFYSK